MKPRRGLIVGYHVLMVFLLLSSHALAQTSMGTILGTVIDTTGAVVPGATVTVINEKTGVSRQVLTDATGSYIVPSLLPSTYTITAELAGFKKQIRSGVTLQVNQTLRVDLVLEIGEISETVQVAGEAPLLSTATSTVGTVIENKKIVDLPLNGRNFTQLTLLVPGAVPQGTTFLTSGTNVSVSGTRFENNNFTLDGVNNNETFFKQFGLQPSIDAIQEFKVQTNITSAEFGAAAGANINVATKSGTNEFHGTLFEFLRNNVLDARDFFASRRPQFRQNQFGGTFGGPVKIPGIYNGKDRTFFFLNYEGFRFRRESTILSSVPTPRQLAGDLSLDHTGRPAPPIYDPFTTRRLPDGRLVRDPFPGNIIPPNRIHPAVALYSQIFLPLPNRPGEAANLINTKPVRLNTDQFTIRVDHKISDKNNFFSRFSFSNSKRIAPTALLTVDNTLLNNFRNVVISDTHIFSPTTILDLKLGYHRDNLQVADSAPHPGPFEFLNMTKLQGVPVKNPRVPLFPVFNVAGLFGVSQSGFPFPANNYQLLGSITKIKGRHFIKTGFDFKQMRNLDDGLFSGIFTFTKDPTTDPQNVVGTGQALASYLLGLPSIAQRNVGDTVAIMRNGGYHFYLQDDIKISSKLTMNLGLRYEWTQWPRHRDDKLASFDRFVGRFVWAGVNPITGEPPNVRRTVADPDFNNFAPRFGLAYLLGSRTTIRAGYGIFYNSNFLWEQQGVRGNWPYAISETLTGLNMEFPDKPVDKTFSPEVAIQPGIKVPPSAQHIISRRNRVGYSQQWNLHIQREVAKDLMVEIGYVRTSGTKLSVFISANDAPPGPGPVDPRRPFPELGATSEMNNLGTSSHHSLQIKAEKRFSQGLTFLASYAFGRTLDIAGAGFSQSASPQDSSNLKADRALSNLHRKHVFSLSYVYELPFGKGKKYLSGLSGISNALLGGWQITGIVALRSGSPFNIALPFDNANVGSRGLFQRPNLVGDPSPPGFERTPERWFNTDAFAAPPRFTFGNLGRNALIGPGFKNWDFGLFKNFQIRENKEVIQFRVEAFNLFNNVNFSNPVGTFGAPTFGRILGSFPARQIQFGLKFIY